MSYYRLYFLNSEDRISRFVELLRDCDEEALDEARALSSGQNMELWNQDRFVARLSADGRVAQSAEAS